MWDMLKKLTDTGIIPVIKVEDPETAVPLANALRNGGINTIEVTVRNNTAFDSIKKIKEAYPDMLVGAGTILNPQMTRQAMDNGADYIVTPGFDEETVTFCQKAGITIIPGCVTPSEVQKAVNMGLKVLKFFPAGRYGGVEGIKELAGPFSDVRFVPTGGIGFGDLEQYLRCEEVAAVGGSFIAKADVIARHDWETITKNCKRCIELALGFEIGHVGMNFSNKEEALCVANELNTRFPLGLKIGEGSTFLGTSVEFMHGPYYGTHGHIGFRTNSAERAKAYFEQVGFSVVEESIAYNDKGVMKFFYLKEEVGGFALHVVKK